MDKSIFNRTVKTNIVLYPTDGMGRDGYITYNDAGFWKENIKQIYPKIKYGRKPFANFKSIRRIPPSWKYHSDGTGRDTYVLYNFGGLIKKYNSPNAPIASLRSCDDEPQQKNSQPYLFLSKQEKSYLSKLQKVQKGLVDRLYNKCIGKFREKNLTKSNSCAALEEGLRQSDFQIPPTRNEIFQQSGYNTMSRSKMLRNSNSFGDLHNINNSNNNDLNYRGNDENSFGIERKGGASSLPKYGNNRYNYMNNCKKYRVKVLSNSLNKDFNFPMIGTPKNFGNEEEKIYI